MGIKAPDPALVDKLVTANRILYSQGIVDGFGHISVRHDSVPDVFLLSCNRAPGLVTREDIVCYDLDGNAVSDNAERPYLERFIHAEIFRTRADVASVVHSHSASVIPFGLIGQRLRPVYHMAGFLGSGAAQFEMREAGGNTDMLIRNAALGRALAQSLGSSNCVLMRGHGSTTAGGSIELAVYRAIYAETNARLQTQALLLSGSDDKINYLTPEEATLAQASTEGQVARCWNLWVGEIDTASKA